MVSHQRFRNVYQTVAQIVLLNIVDLPYVAHCRQKVVALPRPPYKRELCRSLVGKGGSRYQHPQR